MSKNKFSPAMRLYDLLLGQWHQKENYHIGKVLTIIDASIADPEQRKGIKDLIKQSYYNEKDWFLVNSRMILSQFCQKYANFTFSEDEKTYLETGEWLGGGSDTGIYPSTAFEDYFAE